MSDSTHRRSGRDVLPSHKTNQKMIGFVPQLVCENGKLVKKDSDKKGVDNEYSLDNTSL